MNYLSKASILFFVAAVISALMFCIFGTLGIDCGPLVIATMGFFVLAFISGIIGFIANLVYNRKIKPLVYALIGIILSSPAIYLLLCVESGTRARLMCKKEMTGLHNLEILGTELADYAKDHNGYLPVADSWCDELMKHNPELSRENFLHPQHPSLPKENYKFTIPEKFSYIFNFKGQCQFAFNKNLSGMRLDDIPEDVVLIFEADGAWNLNGTSELLKTRYGEDYVSVYYPNGKVHDYWFYEGGVRKFDSKGRGMYHEPPRWDP